MQPSQDGLALAGFSKPLLGRGNSKGIPISKWIGLRLRRKATVRNRPALHPIQVQSDLKCRSFSKLRSADSAHAQTKMAKAQAALVIDIKIFRWRLSNSMIANFTPDPFKHVVCRRHPAQDGVILPPPGPQRHEAPSIRCSERRAEFGTYVSPCGKAPANPNGKPRTEALERRTATPCWPPAAWPTKWNMHSSETEGT